MLRFSHVKTNKQKTCIKLMSPSGYDTVSIPSVEPFVVYIAIFPPFPLALKAEPIFQVLFPENRREAPEERYRSRLCHVST